MRAETFKICMRVAWELDCELDCEQERPIKNKRNTSINDLPMSEIGKVSVKINISVRLIDNQNIRTEFADSYTMRKTNFPLIACSDLKLCL